MNRPKAPGHTKYDELGLSRRATLDEINEAFHELIEKGGYREGVPPQRQWQRARDIKRAHATLSDPASRAEYDESLSRLSSSTVAFKGSNADDLPFSRETAAEQPATAHSPAPVAGAVSAFRWGPTADEPSERPRHVVVPHLDAPADDGEPRTIQADQPDHADAAGGRLFSPPVWASTGAAAALGLLLLYVFSPDSPERRGVASSSDRAPQQNAAPAQSAPTAPLASVVEVPLAAHADASSIKSPSPLDRAPRDQPTEVRPNVQRVSVSADGSEVAVPATAATAERQRQDQRAVAMVAAPMHAQPQARTGLASTDTGRPLTRTTTIILSPTPQQVAAAASRSGNAAPVVSGVPSTGGVAARSLESPARFIGGGPRNADNRRGRYRGVVGVQFAVELNGGVSRCVTMRSSGDSALDQMTCRLVEQRVRYNPATDRLGRPTTSVASATYVWGRGRRP